MSSASRIPVLMYHRVAAPTNAWEKGMAIAPGRFRAQMHALKEHGYQAVGVEAFWQWYQGQGDLPAKSFVITFDDGYLDVYQNAAPVLAELNWPAAVFLVSRLIGGQDVWCKDENPAGHLYPLMNASHIRQLARQGFSFYSHASTHVDLRALTDAALREQLVQSKADIEAMLARPVPFHAYPYGLHDKRVVKAAQEAGYAGCFSVIPGFNRPAQDPFRLRRLDVTDHDTPRRLLRKMAFGSNDGSWLASLRYYFSALGARLGVPGQSNP